MNEDKPNVLLVDDRPENLLALEATLGDLGLNLVKASSGQEALKAVLEREFAVILLDVQMPEMDGFETATRIRGYEQSRHTPIIFVTAVGMEEEQVARGYSVGAVDYLIKPFSPEALRSKVLVMADRFRERIALERRLPEALREEQKVHILLVDDRPENLLAMEEALRDLGENLVTARSAREALRLLLKGDFGLILLDVRMPDVDGFELAEMIRQNRRARDTQIIFTTAVQKAAEDVSRGYSLGAVDYIFTPFDPDILRAKVRALVDMIKRRNVLERQVREIERLNRELRRSEAALRNLNATLEQRVAERTAEVRQAEEKYRNIFENAVEGIFQSTPDGRYIAANPALARMLGYDSPEDLISAVTDIQHQLYVDPERRAEFKRLIEERGVVQEFEMQACRKDGSKVHLSENARAVRDESGAVLYYEGTCEDITERKRLEQQLFQAQKMEATGTLAGGIAHDFNNVLTGIIGFTQLALLEEDLSPRVRDYIARIPEQGKAAAKLISQLLTFSRRAAVEKQPLSLLTLVKETARMLERTLSENIAVRLSAPGEVALVNADPTQMQQVVMNLCVNAGQAMPEGGEMTLSLGNVTIDETYCRQYSYARPGDYVCLSIRDTGIGMSPDVQARIFEPFFTTKKAGEGTGLGLSTVYGIVKTHEGHVNVYSEVGRGSEFRVYIPAMRAGAPLAVAPVREPPAKGTETLLLVEDKETVLVTGRAMLERLGYTVLTATDGEEAIEVYRARRDEIALVLTDMVMPKMGGQELYRALAWINPAVKVLLMSGYSLKQEVDALRAEGVRGFVQKPLDFYELGRAVRQALDEAPQRGDDDR